MPSADKRARKKENARAAREEREAAVRRKKRTRSIITAAIVVAIFAGVIVLLNVTGGSSKKKAAPPATSPSTTGKTTTKSVLPAGCVSTVPKTDKKPVYNSKPPKVIDLGAGHSYTAHVSTTCGAFDFLLDTSAAPETANSFVYLARSHFYDGLKFHRIAKDFVIQGGDPNGDGTGGPGYKLPTEPPANGYRKGTVAMANGGPNTTGSQFFVVLTDAAGKQLEKNGGPPYLYSVLGQVTKGMDVVTKLGSLYNRDQTLQDPASQKTAVPLYIFKVTITNT